MSTQLLPAPTSTPNSLLVPSSTDAFFGGAAPHDGIERSTVDPVERRGATMRPSQAVYRRRRVFLAGLLVAMTVALVAVFGLIGDEAGADDGTLGPAEPTLYIVQPGDSLWSIAETLDPDTDPRPIVDALKDAAGGSALQVGQRIMIPAGLGD